MTWYSQMLYWMGATVYVLALGLGVVACSLGLNGTVVIVAAALIFSAVHGWHQPPVWLVLLMIPVAVGVELSDNLLSAAGVRQAGGSGRTMVWVVVGGLLGALLLGWLAPVTGLVGSIGGLGGLVVGALLAPLAGGLLGGYLAGYWYELRQGRPPQEARRAGWGALKGRLAGSAVKGGLALVMVLVLLGFSF